jgi:hypothetical protein
MNSVLYNIATLAAAQLSVNSELVITTTSMNASYIRATADTLSSQLNSTNFTGYSTVNIPNLCTLLEGSVDCANTALVQQVNFLFIFSLIEKSNLLKLIKLIKDVRAGECNIW